MWVLLLLALGVLIIWGVTRKHEAAPNSKTGPSPWDGADFTLPRGSPPPDTTTWLANILGDRGHVAMKPATLVTLWQHCMRARGKPDMAWHEVGQLLSACWDWAGEQRSQQSAFVEGI